MNFFSVQLNFERNLDSTFIVKTFLVGITFLGGRDWVIKTKPEMTLNVKWRLGAVPQAYELRRRFEPPSRWQISAFESRF